MEAKHYYEYYGCCATNEGHKSGVQMLLDTIDNVVAEICKPFWPSKTYNM